MQQTHAKRKVGGKHNRIFEREAGIDSRTQRPAHSGFAVSIVKTIKKRFRHIKYGFLQ